MVSSEGGNTGVERTRPARTRPAGRAKGKELEERVNMTDSKGGEFGGKGAARTMKSDDEAEEEKKGTGRHMGGL